ncbi:MAG: tetratricopeptide repeat protein [Acidobacteriota bacterium]
MSGLTRQEMKRDEVREWMEVAIDWIAENVRLLIGIAGAIVGVLLLGALLLSVQASRAEAGQEELSGAMRIFSAAIDTVSADPEADPPSFATEEDRAAAAKSAFETLASSRGGDTARIAQIYLGTLAAREGDLATARTQWQNGLDGLSDTALSASIRMNLLSLDRQEGRHEAIIESMQAELEKSSPLLPLDVVLYELARALDATGAAEQARDRYQQLIDEHPGSQFATEARARVG